MSIKNNFTSHLHSFDNYEMFKIENKIKEFKDLAECNQLNGAYVVIVLTSPDESEEDKELYDLHQREADALAQYIMLNMNADLVTIATGMSQINRLVNSGIAKVDYVFYLHEFISSERKVIEAVLTNNNENLKYFELN